MNKLIRLTRMALMAILGSLVISPVIFAKEISLYDQPKSDAKIIGKIDLTAGLIPIFTPEKSEWMKVADPRNGDVGWVKFNDMGANVTFTQRLMRNDGNGLQSYQSVEIGSKPSTATLQQLNESSQKAQAQQAAAQKALSDMMEKMNKVYQQEMETISKGQFPVLLPVIIMPQPATPEKVSAETTKTPASTTITPPNAPKK